MDDKKICTKCSQEKLIEFFSKYKKRDGSIAYRHKCKACTALARREYQVKTKGNDYKPRSANKNTISTVDVLRQPVKNNITEKRNTSMSSVFSSEQIETIKSMIKDYPEIRNVINNRIEFEKVEDIKVKKSITISKFLHDKILEISKTHNYNYSQVVDIVLKKGLENM